MIRILGDSETGTGTVRGGRGYEWGKRGGGGVCIGKVTGEVKMIRNGRWR